MPGKTANFSPAIPGPYLRPGYVTFVSVLAFIRTGIDVVLWCLFKYGNLPILPVATWFLIFLLVDAVLCAACGTLMLLGINWGRILFYVVSFPLFIIEAVYGVSNNPLAIGSAIFGFFVLMVCYLGLSQAGANRYFTGRSRFFKNQRADRDDVSRRHHRDYDY